MEAAGFFICAEFFGTLFRRQAAGGTNATDGKPLVMRGFFESRKKVLGNV